MKVLKIGVRGHTYYISKKASPPYIGNLLEEYACIAIEQIDLTLEQYQALGKDKKLALKFK